MTSTVVLGANALEITRDPVGVNTTESIPKQAIMNVSYVFNAKPITATPGEWGYRYPTMTVLQIMLWDNVELRMELQEVSNQPTWNTGLLTGAQAAAADINAWL